MRKKLVSTVDFTRSLECLDDSIPTTTRLEKAQSTRTKRVNQYRRGPRIGKGRHGEVFLAQDTLNGGRLVVRHPAIQLASLCAQPSSPNSLLNVFTFW